jgi:hypothetical protein
MRPSKHISSGFYESVDLRERGIMRKNLEALCLHQCRAYICLIRPKSTTSNQQARDMHKMPATPLPTLFVGKHFITNIGACERVSSTGEGHGRQAT